MSILSVPNTFSPNTTISSSQVNANFSTIYNEFNGNISAANLAANSVTTAKIADSNVTTAKIADSNVTTAKIADGAVTSPKLAEAFIRGRYQSDTTNTAPTGKTMQYGWGYATAAGTDTATKAVTFPVAFSDVPIVVITSIGSGASNPSSIPDLSNITNATAIVTGTSSTGFTARIKHVDGTNLSTSRNGFTWIAIGTV